MTPKQVTDLAYKQHLLEQTNIRKDIQEKAYIYYMGGKHDVEQYLKDALMITYDTDDIKEMQLNYINFLKKLVNQLAIVYSAPAQRKLVNEEGEEDEEDRCDRDDDLAVSPDVQRGPPPVPPRPRPSRAAPRPTERPDGSGRGYHDAHPRRRPHRSEVTCASRPLTGRGR